tara:strand:- start:194 stop:370 length:177 start_codon:yes stop_codon:yes gene_type:complete
MHDPQNMSSLIHDFEAYYRKHIGYIDLTSPEVLIRHDVNNWPDYFQASHFDIERPIIN